MTSSKQHHLIPSPRQWGGVLLCIAFLCISTNLHATENKPSGQFELGARTSASFFGGNAATSYGTGGQFRIRILDSLNTEWFADYITADVASAGYRQDGHIGWSVLFYPFSNPYAKGGFTPYLAAGHCFDYTRVARYSDNSGESRFSSAVQAGIGTHFHLAERFNLSLAAQYMLHLGSDIHTSVSNGQLSIQKADHAFEGHLLFTFSLNYRVGNLW